MWDMTRQNPRILACLTKFVICNEEIWLQVLLVIPSAI
jgi:hypothetical protein